MLHDLGDFVSRPPLAVHLTYLQHRCLKCRNNANVDTTNLAPPDSHDTHPVIDLAYARFSDGITVAVLDLQSCVHN